MSTNQNEYIISGGSDGKSRLNVLSEVLSTSTLALLTQQGLTTGSSLLDVGCGGGNVALAAANIVGPTGKVTAVDFDEDILSLARKDAEIVNAGNISFQGLSAYDISFSNKFDISYARFLLSHLQYPEKVLQKMVQSLKPGGRIVVEDVQFSGHFCYPACHAFDQYLQYYKALADHNKQNAEIGPSLNGLLREAGLTNIGFDVIQPSFTSGPGKWMAYLTLDRIKAALVAQNMASIETISRHLAELEVFTRDETTTISLPRIFRVWGKKDQ